MNNKKEVKLVDKVKRLLRRLGCQRWLHHFGPKIYEFYEHICALCIRWYCRLSYRRMSNFCDLLGIRCPSKSALQYTMQKIKIGLRQKILELTSGSNHYILALDSTGFSLSNPSYHYLRRIDGNIPKIPVKLSAAFNTKRKKFCAGKIRVLPAHDIKDAKYILARTRPKIAVADKAYSAEALYRFADENNLLLMAPKKKNVKRGYARRKMHKMFRERTYHRRELIESGFGSVKRKFGASVSSKKTKTIKADIYGRLICHNLFYGFIETWDRAALWALLKTLNKKKNWISHRKEVISNEY